MLLTGTLAAEDRITWVPISETRPLEDILAVQAKLRVVTQCDFKETFLPDFAKYFSNRHKIDIRIDKESLQDKRINPELPITFTLRGTSLEAALNLALHPHELAVINDGAGLVVTTREKADQTLVTRGYPVDDLLAPAKSEDSKTLATLLRNVTSGSWADNDKEAGTLIAQGDSLGVRHNLRVHREIEGILKGLRRSKQMQIRQATAVPPVPVSPPGHRTSEWIERTLQEQTHCPFRDNELEEALAFFGDLHHITILLDKAALSDEGISPNEEITLAASGLSLQSALKLILEPLGLTFVNENEVLKVTTQAVADETYTTRVYPIHDLIRAGNERDYESLSNVILMTDTGSWFLDFKQGGMAECKAANSLLIRQTQQVHREIDGILSALRQTKKLPRAPSIAAEFGDPEVLDPFAPQNPPPPVQGFSNPTDIEQVLRNPTVCEFQDAKFDAVLRELQTKHSIPIVLDRPALGDERIDPSQLVTLKSAGRTLDVVLRTLLEPLNLAYVNENEVLKITTHAVSHEKDWPRIYPVEDLTDGQADRLPDLIEKLYAGTEETLLWVHLTQHGGTVAPFEPFNALVIWHTQQAHREVERFFAAERKARQKPQIPSLPASRDAPAILNPFEKIK